MAEQTEVLAKVNELAKRGALFVVNNSGGKDSQAMLLEVLRHVPRSQVLVIHASLGEAGTDPEGAEWPNTREHVAYMCDAVDVPHVVCSAAKTLFGMVDRSAARLREQGRFDTGSPWPSPKYRQCTSDLKRGPIERTIRQWIKANGHCGIVVNAMGLRAEESPHRAKAAVWKRQPKKETKAGAIREFYDWLPVHDWPVRRVFETIRDAGQRWHWAYDRGMERLSCVFCIMASKRDLQVAAGLQPDLFADYVRREGELGKTVSMSGRYLSDIVEDSTEAALPLPEVLGVHHDQPCWDLDDE
jgi:3'-phosphoadenosine 5'-phosphosulfate sulfotransferase (PAPS reductase)/FAD synthetase